MFEKSLNKAVKENCTGCIHKNVCIPMYRLELENGRCSHRIESEVIYHDTYDIRLKSEDTAFVIVGDVLNMSPLRAKVEKIVINNKGKVFYYVYGAEKRFEYKINIFKDKQSCLDAIEFLKKDLKEEKE